VIIGYWEKLRFECVVNWCSFEKKSGSVGFYRFLDSMSIIQSSVGVNVSHMILLVDSP